MAVYNPEALELVRGIYREVMLSEPALDLSDLARDKIAQEILRLVASGRCEREEILAVVLSQIERRNALDRFLPDHDQPSKPNSD